MTETIKAPTTTKPSNHDVELWCSPAPTPLKMLTLTYGKMPLGIDISIIFKGEATNDISSQGLFQEILASSAKISIFLIATVRNGSESVVTGLLTAMFGLTRAVGFRYSEVTFDCVVDIGAGMWDRLFDVPRPEYLHDLEALQGGRHSAPPTPGDLFFHLRASILDMCFELIHQIMRRLGSAVNTYDRVHAFRYLDSRDPLGFVDGTESPRGQVAVAAVFINEGV